MALVRRFMADKDQEGGLIRAKLSEVLDNTDSDISERALFVKQMLNLLKEVSLNRDDRMGFDERTCMSL